MARSPDPAGQDRPWPRWYAERRLGPLAAHPDLVTMAAAAVEAAPHQVALTYYGWMATHAELARLSDGFAAYLASRGVQRGDRVAVCLQTSPHFVVAALGAWKVGAILVTVNPMYREGEVAHLLSDSGAVAVVSSQRGYRTVVAPVLAGTTVRVSVTTSEVDVIDDPDPRVFAGLTDQAVDGTDDLMTVARGHADEGFTAYRPAPGDVAVLCYTSGTTGPAKGAAHPREHRHDDRAERAVAGHAAWLGHLRHRPALPRRRAGAAVAHTLHLAGTLVLPYRTVPEVMLEHLVEYRPRFVVCPPTVYTALMAVPSATHQRPSRRWTCCMPAGRCCHRRWWSGSSSGSASTSTTGTG